MPPTRPKARAPRTQLDEDAASPVSAAPAPPDLAPAPDNGVLYGSRGRAARRRPRQIGPRLSDELYARLLACSEATGISQQRLVVRGIEEELRRQGYGPSGTAN